MDFAAWWVGWTDYGWLFVAFALIVNNVGLVDSLMWLG